MGGRMLAINEGFGYRPLLTVKNFLFVPQLDDRPPSTWVYGDQLISLADMPTEYVTFLRPIMGKQSLWCQLSVSPDETEEQIYAIWPKFPIRVVLQQALTLLHAGKDPLKGYYVQFAGHMGLFSQPDWWRDEPATNY
jgi:hypothetical protein